MRMPWAAHCASMKFGLASVTTNTRRSSGVTYHKCGADARPSCSHENLFAALRTCGDLDKIAPQYQSRRRTGLALRVITRPAADFVESGARVESARRRVILVHLEVDGAQAEAGKA